MYKSNIRIRFKTGNDIKNIMPGEVFKEGAVPKDLFNSLLKGGEITQVKGAPTATPSPVVKNPGVTEKVFNNDPEELQKMTMQDLRAKMAEICSKYSRPLRTYQRKRDIIAALCVDNPEVATHGIPEEIEETEEGKTPEVKTPEVKTPEVAKTEETGLNL
ncbi:MAG: hypothetical protein GY845_25595 [Planctomycetes bacterium]|nr:hypothetical protein [Planctomycetota bacterium]